MMQAIVKALFRDIFSRGWPHLLTGFLGALAMPVFVLAALKSRGALIVEDQAMIIIHSVFLMVNGLVFASATFFILGDPKRLFCLPLSSRFIALSVLIPAFILGTGQVLLYTLIVNLLFGLNWPGLGPAFFMGTVIVSFASVAWLFARSLWILPVVILVLGGESIWFKARFGPWNAMAQYYWTHVTLGEWITMGVTLVVALWFGTCAVALNRCGESINSQKIEAWFFRLVEGKSGPFPVLESRNAAQFWFEWNQKGWLFPGGTLFMGVLGVVFWAIFDRQLPHLYHAFFIGGYLLAILGFISGLVFGNFGPQDVHHEIGHFLASKPMTNRQMAFVTLKVALFSMGLSWAFWAIGFVAVRILMAILGFEVDEKTVAELRWWYWPATLVLPWIALGAGMLMTISGYGLVFFQVVLGAYIFWLVGAVGLSFHSDGVDLGKWFTAACAVFAGLFLAGGTVWLFQRAIRLGILDFKEGLLALVVWLGLAVITGIGFGELWATHGPLLILVQGGLALVLAPYAGAPVALGWNRTR